MHDRLRWKRKRANAFRPSVKINGVGPENRALGDCIDWVFHPDLLDGLPMSRRREWD